jgi:dihydropteroate synthase
MVLVACHAGLGFAKTSEGNFRLIAGLDRVRRQLHGPLQHAPMLVGPSRKGFLGKITGKLFSLGALLFHTMPFACKSIDGC